MAASLLKPAVVSLSPPPAYMAGVAPRGNARMYACFALKPSNAGVLRAKFSHPRVSFLARFSAQGEATEAEEAAKTATQESAKEEIPVDGIVEDGMTGNAAGIAEDGLPVDGVVDNGIDAAAAASEDSLALKALQTYKEAVLSNDESIAAEIEAFLLSIEEEKNSLAIKVSTFTEELAAERDRMLRMTADFENYRKRTERERLSLMTNAQGEVIESLLPVLDNFERAKTQIKVETEGEEKINNSYQSISKQFMEILTNLGVEAVETVGSSFDPMLHEAIMREDSMEYEEGVIIQEFRKGFKIGERLLRPAMVKVSAGPGPAKLDDAVTATATEPTPASQNDVNGGESS